ncbi:MAG: alpha/beta hydrolase [Flavipsychrobacter sp.]|nr:alpha/beta hydrolase [Flavipsychrobacter sp.]
MKAIQSKTILFITGAFVSNRGWAQWQNWFADKGYQTYAPSWPHKDGSPADLRKGQPNASIASLRLSQLVDHYASFIETLPERPIIVGHSFGGLISQLLVQKGVAEAAVMIHSVPPQGVFTSRLSFYKATWGPLGIFTNPNKSFLMNFEQWQYAFTNGMTYEEQRASYEANVIPESKRASRDALTAAAAIDFKKPHVPMLFVAGEIDNIMPASLNKSNFKKYKHTGSVTEFKEFEGRNHYTVAQPGWEKVTNYIYDWIISV